MKKQVTKFVDGRRTTETVDMTQAEIDALAPKVTRESLIVEVRTLAKEKRDAGVMVNGMLVGTDSDARSLLLAGKVNGRSQRKIVTKKGRAKVDQTQMNAVVQAVDDYVQAVMDREYDLLEQIDATADVDLDSIDKESGWPSRGI